MGRTFQIIMIVLGVAVVVMLAIVGGSTQPEDDTGSTTIAPGTYTQEMDALLAAHPVLETFDDSSIPVHIGAICTSHEEDGYDAQSIAFAWAAEIWEYQRLPIPDAQAMVDFALEHCR